MAKKVTNFTAQDAESVDTVEALRADTVPAEQKSTGKKATDKEKIENRFSARFNDREWEYLTEKHWQTRTTITDIIRELVQADMKKHPEILASIDELNKKARPGKDLM
jgi:hypothetical protein